MTRRQNIRKGFGFDNVKLMTGRGFPRAGERLGSARERRF
jgi:hypothetical protein